MHQEFSETRDLANISFFKTPKDAGKYEIRQSDKFIIVSREGIVVEKVELYLPARIIAVHVDDYKICVVLRKAEEKKWQTVKGPVALTNSKQTNYEDSTEETKKKGLWEFLEEVYFNGDEETKKAMIDSFRESQGQVLNTNWKTANKK
ncbi:6-phosphogluconate dehydrogenase [Ecytonucleospora hepatopenaei]|uniref:6-phosphogluconate dehydrogenase n=1 Tax=Ecytonucleospora hepatopenaei TaxID=646526 RepID=A0A1W0E2Q1_9MICR|nr:hypothetical protein EHP00_1814 [Ecytonucleospora hepatopenaei]OQS53499.1 6-phosphogluconate dehydrogenase [Ecytonucleospora hepatopenaei]